ncbi:MAG TPA: MerR family transcriptional regulator [Bryocella sp.]|nr:MerR family transcriptional regulator [Bryocella sp.]
MQSTFTSREVVALTGISPRQLQWWDERGIVVPEREGHRRLYSPDDLAEVAVICELRQRGFSLQKIRRVLRFLHKEIGARLVETVAGTSEYHLLTDGRHIYLEHSARGVVDLLKNARQPMLTVCLSDTLQRVFSPLQHPSTRPRARSAASGQGSSRPHRRPPVRVVVQAAAKQNGSVPRRGERGKKAS